MLEISLWNQRLDFISRFKMSQKLKITLLRLTH